MVEGSLESFTSAVKPARELGLGYSSAVYGPVDVEENWALQGIETGDKIPGRGQALCVRQQPDSAAGQECKDSNPRRGEFRARSEPALSALYQLLLEAALKQLSPLLSQP